MRSPCPRARRSAPSACATAATLWAFLASGAPGDEHPVHLFPSASDERGREGFVRVVNHSAVAGEVEIRAYDDAGSGYGPATLTLGSGAAAHFNSGDLENGNAGKGLSGGTGPGEGDWRLELTSDLDIEVLAYVRTADGFLTSMHDAAPAEGSARRLAVFNPGSNTAQVSLLRLANAGSAPAEVTVTGVDDNGLSPGPGASATVPAGGALTFTAAELESGDAPGLEGSLGDGAGKWRLVVETDAPVAALGLLSSPSGHLTNLSTAPGGGSGRHVVPLFPPASDAPGRQGFVRVANRSGSGEAKVEAWDDGGRAYWPATLAPRRGRTTHFNSADLENGNEAKRLYGATGPAEGNRRVDLTSDLDLEVTAFIRTQDGFLTAMHDLAPRLGRRHRVPMFNPGSNTAQESLLRLVNPGDAAAAATVDGVDDAGDSPGSTVRASVPAHGALTLSARELESGGDGLTGALGDGQGKWRLTVRSDRALLVMSLLSSPSGHLTNLSTAPGRGAGPPETAEEMFEAQVSPVVQSKCAACHVAGGDSGHTRLVFATAAAEDHLATNLAVFENFLRQVENGTELILAKIQGVDHGGGVQVARDSTEWRRFEDFLARLRTEQATIAGTAYDGAGSPLAGAKCEFAGVAEDRLGPGERLAVATADAEGAFELLAPPVVDGFLSCRPAGFARAALRAFARSGAKGSTATGHAVSPRTTAGAAVLAAEAVRNPAIDLRGRAQALPASLSGDPDFELLADAAAGLFRVLEERDADLAYFELLLDAFGNSRIDDAALDADLLAALDSAIADAEQTVGRRAYAAAAQTLLDLPMLADAHGLTDPAPPPPLTADPEDLSGLADGLRSAEFANNPSLYYLNAHWAYARGVDGSGETTGMVDTGIYAAHEEFAGQLHDDTVYTVVNDVSPDALLNAQHFDYYKVGEKDPGSAYPDVGPDPDSECRGIYCRFYYYNHGSLMASLAAGARNDTDAHGVAFGAELLFRPTRQYRTDIGRAYYYPPNLPDKIPDKNVTRHGIVREIGDLAPIVSNSWLTGNSTYWTAAASQWPFHEVLTPRYARCQLDRRTVDQAVFVWSAGNQPRSGGPWTDGATTPSVTERQLRALSGGEKGLAELLLTHEERAGLSADEALRRAELVLKALRRRWLAVVALGDFEDTDERWREHVGCAVSAATDAKAPGDDCAPDWTFGISARCGFASDWCVAAGPSWGGVDTHLREPPQPTGRYMLDAYRTSEAAATAGGALAVLVQAYRDSSGRLAAAPGTVLKRLAATARRDLFDPDARHGADDRNVLLREEDMIRSLIRYAGASDDDLREFIDTARAEVNGTATDDGDDGGPDADDRLRVLNRFVPYYETIDAEPIRDLLNAAEADPARARDLLAQLIRQIEWIDEQLRRRGVDKDTATDEDIRDIAITSLIGHGLIDLKAATDPMR